MKNNNRLFAIILTVAMVFSVFCGGGITAFADETDETKGDVPYVSQGQETKDVPYVSQGQETDEAGQDTRYVPFCLLAEEEAVEGDGALGGIAPSGSEGFGDGGEDPADSSGDPGDAGQPGEAPAKGGEESGEDGGGLSALADEEAGEDGGGLAAMEESGEDGGGAIVPLAGEVCEIVGGSMYTTLANALTAFASTANGSSTTIRLLENIHHSGTITVNSNKTLTFDLNGHTLDVEATGEGLHLQDNGQLKLLDPSNGKLNITITGTGDYARGVSAMFGTSAEVTNIKSNRYGVYTAGGRVTVHGDLTVVDAGDGSVPLGIYAYNAGRGGEVTVDGVISVPPGVNHFICLMQTEYKEIGDTTSPSTKMGYSMYKSSTLDCYVWVKIQNYTPSCEIIGGMQYDTLDNALAAVGNGQTIRLLSNITVFSKRNDRDDIYDIDNNRDFTIDLNGMDLKLANPSDNGGLCLSNETSVNFVYNGGNLQMGSWLLACEASELTLPYVNGSQLWAYSLGKIIVNGDIVSSNPYAAVLAEVGGSVTVGGNVYATGLKDDPNDVKAGFAVSCEGMNSGVAPAVIINGDVFSNNKGVRASSTGGVTIGGTLTVPAGKAYIKVAYSEMKKGDGVASAAKPGYLEYQSSSYPYDGTVWVADPNSGVNAVCEVIGGGKYENIAQAIAAVPTGGSATIRMLADHNYTYNSAPSLSIRDKAIVIDLNGKILNISNTIAGGSGLLLSGGANLSLLDPYNGELNVFGRDNGLDCNGTSGNPCAAVVTSATADTWGVGGAYCTIAVIGDVRSKDGGVMAYVDTNVTVGGDVYISPGGTRAAVNAGANSTVTVDGRIIAPAGTKIEVYLSNPAPSATTTKPGYITYTSNGSTVWLKGVCSVSMSLDPSYHAAYDSVLAAVSAIPTGKGAPTITMHRDHTEYGSLTTGGLTFDLNGYVLNLINTSGPGIYFTGGGSALNLVDPKNGEFNVTGTNYGVFAENDAQVAVTNVTATTGIGVYCEEMNSLVHVYGNVTSHLSGAWAENGAGIRIDGTVTVLSNTAYVEIEGYGVGKDDYEPVSSVPGYFQYGTSSFIYVKDPDAVPVCSIGETLYYDFYSAWSAAGYSSNSSPIKLLRNIDYGQRLYVGGRTITLDLNGYVLNVDSTGSSDTRGLEVGNNGGVKLLDPYNGEFNVTGYTYGIYISNLVSNAMAEVSSAKATSTASGTKFGVQNYGVNSLVTVYGDVSSTGLGVVIAVNPGSKIVVHGNVAANSGAEAAQGGEITVNGAIIVPQGSGHSYIRLNGVITTQYPAGSEVSDPDNPGYFLYKDSQSPPNIVRVRNPEAFVPVTSIAGGPQVAVAGIPLTLTGSALPGYATNRTISWSVQSAGTTGAVLSGNVLTTTAAGTVSVLATVANGAAEGVAYTQTFSIQVLDPQTSLISITPSHAILANTTDSAKFTATLVPAFDSQENYSKIAWTVTETGGAAAAALITTSGGGKRASVRMTPTLGVARTLTVTATWDKMYTATATIEILPTPTTNVNAKLLDTKATVNNANTVGALVPILITNQSAAGFGMGAFSLGAFAEPEAVGSIIVEKVELFSKSGSSLTDNASPEKNQYSARMYGYDDRYIAIDALSGAKSQSGVTVKLTLQGGTTVEVKGTLKLTVANTKPKVTLKAGQLNLAFPGKTATLTATSKNGVCTINSVQPSKTADSGKLLYFNKTLSLGAAMKKAGTVSMSANVSVEGYKAINVTVKVKVVNAKPKIKLSKSSVTLLPDGIANSSAKISLVTSDKKVPFESGYKVTGVTSATDKTYKSNIDVSYSGGVISIKPGADCKSGTALIKVAFDGVGTVNLKLKVTMLDGAGKIKLSTKVKSATVNVSSAAGAKIADIPITLNAANHAVSGWKVVSVGSQAGFTGTISQAITVTPGRNQVTLSVKDPARLSELAPGSKAVKFALKIGSEDVVDAKTLKPKTVAFTLTVSPKAQTISLSLKNKIDIANPQSAITATVKAKNTSATLGSVALYERFAADGTPLAAETVHSKDFQVTGVSGNKFAIMAAHSLVVPGAPQKLSAVVTLTNGKSFTKQITVTPKQTGKAVLSKKSVTLNRWTPLAGDTVGLSLKAPKGATLGAASLNEASLTALNLTKDGTASNKSNGFKLVKSGANDYTIYFADSIAPRPPDKNGKRVELKSSYTIKLDLWAEGTYKLDTAGNPVALQVKVGSKTYKSKPTTVKIKVNIK